MPKRSLKELAAVRAPRQRLGADTAEDDFSQMTLSTNIAYLPEEEGRVKTLRIKGPGFKNLQQTLRTENPEMFQRPERADERSVWNSGWRITWGDPPHYVSALSWFSEPTEESLAFGAFIATMIKDKIRGVRFWCHDDSMICVLQEQVVPIQVTEVPPVLDNTMFGFPPIQCKLNYTDGPVLLVVRDFARASPVFRELDWERFTTDSGRPGWAKQWSTWPEAREYMTNVYNQLQKPTMIIENLTKPTDDHYNRSCFFLMHILRMNATRITVCAISRENAETIEKANTTMLNFYTLLRHHQTPKTSMACLKQLFQSFLSPPCDSTSAVVV